MRGQCIKANGKSIWQDSEGELMDSVVVFSLLWIQCQEGFLFMARESCPTTQRRAISLRLKTRDGNNPGNFITALAIGQLH
jgi:hypothetical protein